MSSEMETPSNKALLVLPRLRVQNANAISSPMTWGFPSITAFTGLMTAIERKLGPGSGINFHRVGTICHGFEAQVTAAGYTRSFRLTRNPLLQDGSTAAIVEEGRAHLDITLVFDVELASSLLGEADRLQLATRIGELVSGMRIAGGSVIRGLQPAARRSVHPYLTLEPDDEEDRTKWFRRLSRRWLPGFALVAREDLLQTQLQQLQASDPAATALDAWLDLSRLNYRATRTRETNSATQEVTERVEWLRDQRPGWIVPIPVGYAALSELYPPGRVAGVRDQHTSFRFVESVYSIGQWISPHRLKAADDLMWQPLYEAETGHYRCYNSFAEQPTIPHQ